MFKSLYKWVIEGIAQSLVPVIAALFLGFIILSAIVG